MQHVLQKNMAWLIGYGDTLATADHTKVFYDLVSRRYEGRPIAYLTGSRDFWSLTLNVDDNVLIPRADTETLVEEALERLPKDQIINVLDLGTGSGAIALAIAKERPLAQVIALEYQTGALKVAEQNAVLNKLNNVEFRLSDWFSAVSESEQFDLIASNPPYIEPGDPHLSQGDLRFEPISALTALGNGLADIKNIIQTAPRHLKDDGWLIIEHGYNQADAVQALFKESGFNEITLFKDINHLPRCIVGKKTNLR